MGRQSKIDRLGLGAKIMALAMTGMPHDRILKKLKVEHGQTGITYQNLSAFLKTHTLNALSEQPDSLNTLSELPSPTVISELSVKAFREQLGAALSEARGNYDRFKDDPKAGWGWFKNWLDSIDRMGKAVGGFQPETQIAIGLRIDRMTDSRCRECPLRKYPEGTTFPEVLKIWEDFFAEIDRMAVNETVQNS